MATSILIVEDDRASRDYLRLLLERQDFSVRAVTNGVEAMVALEAAPYDLILSDVRMPQMDGMELLTRVAERWPELPVVLISADTDLAQMIEAVRIGAINYIVKPASAAAVSDAVQRALGPRVAPSAADRSIPEIIGVSREIVEVRHLVAMAARADVSVLLTGDPGTGKSLAARAIHHHSCLSEGPFVRYNCAEMLRDDFESEFFGHLRGAFDGADEERVGLLTRAHGGVLYLDRIDRLSTADQSKLLRAIEECEVKPLGADTRTRFSVRFVVSTVEDPRTLIAENELREDLYYRLRGFEIALPALRERASDVPLLIDHFLGSDAQEIELEAVDLLSRAQWPENVRQLSDVIEQSRKAAGRATITVSQIPLELLSAEGLAAAASEPEPVIPPNTTLRDLERRAIIQALKDCDGNRSKAARVLGIDRSTLRRKIVEFGIQEG